MRLKEKPKWKSPSKCLFDSKNHAQYDCSLLTLPSLVFPFFAQFNSIDSPIWWRLCEPRRNCENSNGIGKMASKSEWAKREREALVHSLVNGHKHDRHKSNLKCKWFSNRPLPSIQHATFCSLFHSASVSLRCCGCCCCFHPVLPFHVVWCDYSVMDGDMHTHTHTRTPKMEEGERESEIHQFDVRRILREHSPILFSNAINLAIFARAI